MTSVGGLGSRPWELTQRSTADKASLKAFAIDPDALSGSFLVDADDTVTNGVLLRPDMLGSKFDPPGWEKAKAALADAPAVVLPVASSGVTTELPTYAFAVAIRGATPDQRARCVHLRAGADQRLSRSTRRSADLAGDRHSTATWRFLDSNGAVVATTLGTGLGAPVPDPACARSREGLHQIGDKIVVSADVPVVGWRVVFTQNRSEFVEPLAGPLQSAGLILVLLLLAVGPHPDDRARPAAAAVARGGAPATRAQPLAGGVHLGGLPRAAHTGVRRARLPADQPRPLGSDERRGPPQRRTPCLHQRA